MRIQQAAIILLCLMLSCCGNLDEAIEQKEVFKLQYNEPVGATRKFTELLRHTVLVNELSAYKSNQE